MTKPNFKQMSLKELRKYVLVHRDDEEAWREYADRPRNSIKFPPSKDFNSDSQIIKNLIERATQKDQ